MSKPPALPLKYWVGGLLARKALQPAWRALNALSYWGLGYNNWISTANGEDRFISTWAPHNSARPPIVFDVGANEGDTTAKFLEAAPHARCYLFEPNSSTFERLARRFAGNTSVTLNNKGVGCAPGRLTLHDFNGAGSERASFVGEVFTDLMGSDNTKLRHIEVEVVTLDDYAAALGIAQIDFLKIDTEGFERFVLEGAQNLIAKGSIQTIMLEMNEHNVISGFNVYRLHKMLPNFEIFRILPSGLEPVATRRHPYLPALDVPRYANLVAVARNGH